VLGSLKDRFVPGPDGSVALFFGPSVPEGRKSPWSQTAPGTGFFPVQVPSKPHRRPPGGPSA
jgi:hypothetical protein